MTGKQYVEKVNPGMVFCVDDYAKVVPGEVSRSEGSEEFYKAITKNWNADTIKRVEDYFNREALDRQNTVPAVNTKSLGWEAAVSDKKDMRIINRINCTDDTDYTIDSVAAMILNEFYMKDQKGIIYVYTMNPNDPECVNFAINVVDEIGTKLCGNSEHATTYDINLYKSEGGGIVCTSPAAMVEFLRNGFPCILKDIADYSAAEELILSIMDRSWTHLYITRDAGALAQYLGLGKASKKGDFVKFPDKATVSNSELLVDAKNFDTSVLNVPKKTTWSPVKFADYLLMNFGYIMDLTWIPADSKFPNLRKVLGVNDEPDYIEMDSRYPGFYGTGMERKTAINRIIEFCMQYGNMPNPEPPKPLGICRVEKKITVI